MVRYTIKGKEQKNHGPPEGMAILQAKAYGGALCMGAFSEGPTGAPTPCDLECLRFCRYTFLCWCLFATSYPNLRFDFCWYI